MSTTPSDNERLNELESRLRQSSASSGAHGGEDEFLQQLLQNWQKIVGSVAIVLLGVWLWGEYQTAQKTQQESVATRFADARAAFEALPAETDAAKVLEKEKILLDNLEQLSKSHGEGIYGGLAKVYQAAAALRHGEAEKARTLLRELPILSKGKPVMSPSLDKATAQDLTRELASLVYARALLQDAQVERAEKREYLLLISEYTTLVPVEALHLLRLVTSSAEEKQALQAAEDKLRKRRPELSDLLDTQPELPA